MRGPGSGHAQVTVRATHLYPGLQLDVPSTALLGNLIVVLSDGVAVDAELLRDDRGRLVLRVDSYRTGAGTRLPEKLWPVRAADQAVHPVRLVLGRAYLPRPEGA